MPNCPLPTIPRILHLGPWRWTSDESQPRAYQPTNRPPACAGDDSAESSKGGVAGGESSRDALSGSSSKRSLDGNMQWPPTGRKAASRGLIPGLLRRGLRPAQRRGALAAGLSCNICRATIAWPRWPRGARAWRGRLLSLVAAEAQTCRFAITRRCRHAGDMRWARVFATFIYVYGTDRDEKEYTQPQALA